MLSIVLLLFVTKLFSQEILLNAEAITNAYVDLRSELPNLIPAGTICESEELCTSKHHCAAVCKKGTVKVDIPLQFAIQTQYKVQRNTSICHLQLLGTHNSAIDLSDKYGLEDYLWSKLMKIVQYFDKTAKLQTSDQYFTLTDQLNLGVRQIELDVHYFLGDLRIGHCGGFQSDTIDNFINHLNELASYFHWSINWDSETIGCKPSLSSIPAIDSRTFISALQEIKSWLDLPQNKEEIVFIYLDNEMDLQKWGMVNTLTNQIISIFGDKIFNKNDLINNKNIYPTWNDLLRMNKNVVIISSSEYSNIPFFTRHNLCNNGWIEPDLNLFEGYPKCVIKDSNGNIINNLLDINRQIVRMETSEIQYGPVNNDGKLGYNKNVLNETMISLTSDCGINMIAPDNLVGLRSESWIWNWDMKLLKEDWNKKDKIFKCILMDVNGQNTLKSGKWFLGDENMCNIPRFIGCRDENNVFNWVLSDVKYSHNEAKKKEYKNICNENFTAIPPNNGGSNNKLKDFAQSLKIDYLIIPIL